MDRRPFRQDDKTNGRQKNSPHAGNSADALKPWESLAQALHDGE
jgi:hypothetical protein